VGVLVKREKVKQLAAMGLQLSITGNLCLAIASRYARVRVKDGPELIGPAQQQVDVPHNQSGFIADTVVVKNTLGILADKTLSLEAKLMAATLALQKVAGCGGDGLDITQLHKQTRLKRSAVLPALVELKSAGYVRAHLGKFRMYWFNGEPNNKPPAAKAKIENPAASQRVRQRRKRGMNAINAFVLGKGYRSWP
jgi:hypothetical protein